MVEVNNGSYKVENGWDDICKQLNREIKNLQGEKKTVVIETYQGVLHEELMENLQKGIKAERFVKASGYMLPEEEIKEMVFPDVTNDRIFGFLTRLKMDAFFDPDKVKEFQNGMDKRTPGVTVIYGCGAALLCPKPDLLIYADMARREIQLRMREHLVDNIGVINRNTDDWMLLYKQGYFVDWRICDRFKKQLFKKWDYLLDTNIAGNPKLIKGRAIRDGLWQSVCQPFSVVPFFDPGPWGGKWMKEVCGLNPGQENYAWCFNCVPEENSLLLKFGEDIIEIPSINLVFMYPRELLGEAVHGRFGDEFPIRFDFLDTMQGGNLSLQVHPLTEYIQEKFGMHYTQDESYYIMDAGVGAQVYLGLREGVNPENMIKELEEVQAGDKMFNAEKHVQTWPAKKHDHFLIPAGTVHCSGENSLVLEISATPYIFTFKLWDWGRLGLDGKPRPINIKHGKNVIQWDRTTEWTEANLVNRIERIAEGDGWVEEQTGLHEREFIETRRHWFTKPVPHHTHGGVNVICLVEGNHVTIESPKGRFQPMKLNYAEVAIFPAALGEYVIRPESETKEGQWATIKAFVRKNP